MAEPISNKQILLLRARLQRFGHFKYPRLRIEIDDLVGQTLADLWRFLNGRAADHPIDVHGIRKVAFTIFDRRAVDLQRKHVLEWASRADGLAEEIPAEPDADESTAAELYRRMLTICVAELTQCSVKDRLILAMVTGLGSNRSDAMTPAERQRLHRLRRRLAAAIGRELGDDAISSLR